METGKVVRMHRIVRLSSDCEREREGCTIQSMLQRRLCLEPEKRKVLPRLLVEASSDLYPVPAVGSLTPILQPRDAPDAVLLAGEPSVKGAAGEYADSGRVKRWSVT